MYRFYALLAFGAVFVVCMSVVFGSILGEKKRKKAILSALDANSEERGESHNKSVKEMLTLYINMVAKHGPDSEEAKAFRFGTDSVLVRSLYENNEALAAFNRQADIVDEVCRKFKRRLSGPSL